MWIRRLATALVFLISANGSASPHEVNVSPKIVLIGVENYVGNELVGPVRDVCAIYLAYSRILKISAAEIIVHTDRPFEKNSPCRRVATQEATVRNILATFGRLARIPGAHFIHFSGHGEERSGNQILRLSERNRKNATDEVISLEEIHKIFSSKPLVKKEVIYFIDACREEVGETRGTRPHLQRTFRTKASFTSDGGPDGAIFFATLSGGKSLIRTRWNNGQIISPIGYFTWTVIKAMLGAVGTGGGRVAVEDLGEYVKKETTELLAHELTSQRVVQEPEVQFFNERSRKISFPVAPRSGSPSFLIFIEAQAVPLDSMGKEMGPVSHHDVIVRKGGFELTEFFLLDYEDVQFPGPFEINVPIAGITRPIVGWDYRVRLTYLFGSDRREFILCSKSPVIPEQPSMEPEVRSRFVGNKLVVDARKSLALVGRSMSEAMEDYDVKSAPTHIRHPNSGCM